MPFTVDELRKLATEAGHYLDSEVHDFLCYVESLATSEQQTIATKPATPSVDTPTA
ncbi:MAG: hypothetical protein WC426_02520 [Sulfuriferula sp.]